ncbi:alpha/beta hydrolase family protein [Ancylobacter terrae]|uniref:alpha/beta hydrolase family protein n=1 Tax=Ancylobacter sp. sgz301288 TaxID=3342077 RepID=UPI00385E6D65
MSEATLSAPDASTTAGRFGPNSGVVTELVAGSRYPVHFLQVETRDGLYAPIALRLPVGEGPFPLVLFATGNGGGGLGLLRELTHNRSWTQERFLDAGYAVAWTRYRAEVDYAYDRFGVLVEDIRQGRQLLNRGPLEYEDLISIAEHAKTLPFIDGERIGYMGMSHGGEMALKIASEYRGFRAMIASEPASHEFVRLRPDETAHVDPVSGLLNVERMLMRDPAKVRARITEEVARARVAPIATPILVQGRDTDELQGIFRVSYDLLAEADKEARWQSYDHDEHGFVYVGRNDAGVYEPDPVQTEAVRDSIAFFDEYLKR